MNLSDKLVKQKVEQAGKRALEEAKERQLQAKTPEAAPKEINGRGGADPARYGDWEKKGIAVDF
ncbi:MAG: DUF1674 domain-containing protein [Nitratireductor sp.]